MLYVLMFVDMCQVNTSHKVLRGLSPSLPMNRAPTVLGVFFSCLQF